MGPILMDNRHGLVVNVQINPCQRHRPSVQRRSKMLLRPKRKRRRLTAGADKGHDCKACCQLLAIDRRTTRHEGYQRPA